MDFPRLEQYGSIRWRRLQGQLEGVVVELTRMHFSVPCLPGGWSPAINAFRCRDRIEIYVELAGVERGSIQLEVEPRRVRLCGRREPPGFRSCAPVQVLAMEIDSGGFERELNLNQEVDADRATAEQQNGVLQILLPLRAQG